MRGRSGVGRRIVVSHVLVGVGGPCTGRDGTSTSRACLEIIKPVRELARRIIAGKYGGLRQLCSNPNPTHVGCDFITTLDFNISSRHHDVRSSSGNCHWCIGQVRRFGEKKPLVLSLSLKIGPLTVVLSLFVHAQEPHGSCGSRPKSLGGGSGRRSVRRQTGLMASSRRYP